MKSKGCIVKRRNMVRQINAILDHYEVTEKRLMGLLRVEIGVVSGLRHRQTPIFSETELESYLDRLKSVFKYKGDYHNLDLFE